MASPHRASLLSKFAVIRVGWCTRWVSEKHGVSYYNGISMFYLQILHFRSGAEGIRTPDLRRAKAALSQLSYGP